jgi:hypothetical protein
MACSRKKKKIMETRQQARSMTCATNGSTQLASPTCSTYVPGTVLHQATQVTASSLAPCALLVTVLISYNVFTCTFCKGNLGWTYLDLMPCYKPISSYKKLLVLSGLAVTRNWSKTHTDHREKKEMCPLISTWPSIPCTAKALILSYMSARCYLIST